MSNVIKGYLVRYNNDTLKLDYNERSNEIQRKYLENNRVLPVEGIVQKENHEFLAGINAVSLTVEEEDSQAFSDARCEEEEVYIAGLKEEAELKIQRMLLDARQEAEEIINNVKKQAEQEKKKLFQQAERDGYQAGMKKGEKETALLKVELDKERTAFYEEQDRALLAMEPQVVSLVIDLVQKLTGILLSDREEILFYLVQRAFADTGTSGDMIIKTAKEDYPYLMSKKEELKACMKEDARLEILESPMLKKAQCQIETDSRIIDLSLDVQLKNLTERLQMLSLEMKQD